MTKALALFSGGLDSILAVRLLREQGVEVEAVHGVSLFTRFAAAGGRRLWPAVAAEMLGIKLHLFDASPLILDCLNNPRHGLGSVANPCIDCRIAMLRKAARMMPELGASFLVTGEVVGQRPMSQRRRALELIDREAGLVGLVLRPLTALNLPPTIPEERGWVDRRHLLDLRGRSRKPQIALAERWGISQYPTAAGGCLLTDPAYGARIRDLLLRGPVSLVDAHLCKLGRHLRLNDWGKVIVGRNRLENPKIATLAREGDWLLWLLDRPGPTTLLRAYHRNGDEHRSEPGEDHLELAARITARYAKCSNRTTVRAWRKNSDTCRLLTAEPLESGREAELLI